MSIGYEKMSSDQNNSTYRLRPAFPGEGPKNASPSRSHEFYDPMTQPAWQDDSFYREPARVESLKRRCGFPSYLNPAPKNPS